VFASTLILTFLAQLLHDFPKYKQPGGARRFTFSSRPPRPMTKLRRPGGTGCRTRGVEMDKVGRGWTADVGDTTRSPDATKRPERLNFPGLATVLPSRSA